MAGYRIHRAGVDTVMEVFTPAIGVAISGIYTPIEVEIVKLGNDVDITIDSITITYTAGSEIGLTPDKSYTFSIATNVHKM